MSGVGGDGYDPQAEEQIRQALDVAWQATVADDERRLGRQLVGDPAPRLRVVRGPGVAAVAPAHARRRRGLDVLGVLGSLVVLGTASGFVTFLLWAWWTAGSP